MNGSTWQERDGRLFVDVFVPEKRVVKKSHGYDQSSMISKRACSFRVAKKDVPIGDNIFVGDFGDTFSRYYKNENKLKKLESSGKEIIKRAMECDGIPKDAPFYACLRKGSLKDQREIPDDLSYKEVWEDDQFKDYVNPCLIAIPKISESGAVELVATIAGSGEYVDGGDALETWYGMNRLPAKECPVTIRGKNVLVDCGIAGNIETLNKNGYETRFSCSGMASDHYGVPRVVHKYVNMIENPYISIYADRPERNCIIESMNDNDELIQRLRIDEEEDHLDIYLVSNRNIWKNVEDPVKYDRVLKKFWNDLTTEIAESRCAV